jgi:hypothetical protein
MSDSFGLRDWIDKAEKLERNLAEALKANRELNAECMKEAVRADKFERELAAMKATASLEPLAKLVESTPFRAGVSGRDDYDHGVEHGLSLAAAIIRNYESELDRRRGAL